MFAPGARLLKKARKGRYAVGAFNIMNIEGAQAVLGAARAVKSPALLQVTQTTMDYVPHAVLKEAVAALAKSARVPVCLHLDHGKNLDVVKQAIKLGFSSVMMDGSRFSFAKNVRVTREAVKAAHRKGVSVEGELGALGRVGDVPLTEPRDAVRFVEESGCDYLAVAVGTSHGAYKFKGKAKVDVARIKEIAEVVNVPLVLHGASHVDPTAVKKANKYGAKIKGARGVPDAVLKKAVKAGVCKVNIDTDSRLAFTAGVRAHLVKSRANFDPRKYLSAGRGAMQKAVEKKMQLLGSARKA